MTDETDSAASPAQSPGSAALPAVRHNRLIDLLRRNGQMTVAEMVEQLSVSRDTIRRDLDQLESRGLILRTHGGAIYNDALVRVDTTLGTRMDAFTAAKQRMGKAAADLIRDGETLIVNGGSSTCYFAAALGERQNLTVITNNLRLPPVAPENALRTLHILGESTGRSHRSPSAPLALPKYRASAPTPPSSARQAFQRAVFRWAGSRKPPKRRP